MCLLTIVMVCYVAIAVCMYVFVLYHMLFRCIYLYCSGIIYIYLFVLFGYLYYMYVLYCSGIYLYSFISLCLFILFGL